MEINGLLGILRNPHFVDGIVVGIVSKRFHLNFCTLLLTELCTWREAGRCVGAVNEPSMRQGTFRISRTFANETLWLPASIFRLLISLD